MIERPVPGYPATLYNVFIQAPLPPTICENTGPSFRQGGTYIGIGVWTVHNYSDGEIEENGILQVEKRWDDSIDAEDIPTFVRLYLLQNGKRVKDGTGQDVYVDLNEANNWKAFFNQVDPQKLQEYTVEEVSESFIAIYSQERQGVHFEFEREGDNIFENYGTDTVTTTLYLVINGDEENKLESQTVNFADWEKMPVRAEFDFNLPVTNPNAYRWFIEYYHPDNGKPLRNNLDAYTIYLDSQANGDYVLRIPTVMCNSQPFIFEFNTAPGAFTR